jgi:predicted acylesterase/phospholipase RssA
MEARLPFVVHGGPGALAHIERHGLSPGDIACIPAAAGGPKGLALLPLDRLLHTEWLKDGGSIELIGASIGAWRMAALAQPEPLAALERLQHAYVHDQRYPAKPTPLDVSRACRRLAAAVLGEGDLAVRKGVALTIVTARARGPLAHAESKLAFGRAMLSNSLSRRRLAAYLERVVFQAGEPSFLAEAFDAFGLVRVPIDTRNQHDALLASGTIPLVCAPVRDIDGAPHGRYWDGALVDYHLLLPYTRLVAARRAAGRGSIILYPHFNSRVTPGWLDKHLPWRRASSRHPWLENVLLIAPSGSLIESLPNSKLPDRQDFYRYGADHAGRERAWNGAIGECERFAEAVLRWMSRPDPTLIRPL